jgi:hypothetical protein
VTVSTIRRRSLAQRNTSAEYVGPVESDHCQFCHQPIAGNYCRVNGTITCCGCAEISRRESARDTHSAYTRALLYGVGAALAGMILYAAFEIATGIIIGYLSLAVGWMVGKAMMKGSNGVGGRRYQIAAVLLTYAAVSIAAVPVMIHYARNHQRQTQSQRQKLQDEQRELESDSGQAEHPHSRPPKMNLAPLLGRLALFGLASPFLEVVGNPVGGLIGLVILFVGIRIAARITAARPAQVFGPFSRTV